MRRQKSGFRSTNLFYSDFCLLTPDFCSYSIESHTGKGERACPVKREK